ncbi:MAG: S-layer homology domain-containing protein [Tissierellia bacterium]|nr:S-layer homology domain-containing protein [Tissierellia bacterium]
MKKFQISAGLCLLFFILLLPVQGVFAQGDILIDWKQPALKEAQEGDSFSYKLDIYLPANTDKRLLELNLTLRFDDKLDVKDYRLEGANLQEGDYKILHSVNQTNGKNFISLSIHDLTSLAGDKDLSLVVDTVVKPGKFNVTRFENDYVLSYLDSNQKPYHEQKVVETLPGPGSEGDLPEPGQGTYTRAMLQDYVNAAFSLDRRRLSQEEAYRIDAALYLGRFYLVKSDLSQGEIQRAIQELSQAMDAVRPAYLKGYPDGTFRPKHSMTRAEVASMFARVMNGGEVPSGSSSFRDVPRGSWYDGAVAYMEESQLVRGYEDGTYRPNKTISRAEFASIVVKFSKLSSQAGAKTFKDVPQGHWAAGNIAKVTAAGLMEGRSEGVFAPNDQITRQEVATVMNKILYRQPNEAFLRKYAENPFTDLSEEAWSYTNILEAAGQ